MKGGLILCSLLALALLSTNFLGAAGNEPAALAGEADLPPEHLMSFQFDAWAMKESYLGQEWDLFRISGCIEQGIAGQPRIPHKVVNLQLPAPLVKTEVTFSDLVRYDGVVLEPRAPDYLPGLDMLDPSHPLVDFRMYAREGLQPATSYRVEKLGEGKSDTGQRIWAYSIVLNPLRYDPVKGVALLYQSCELKLHYDNAPSYFPPPRGPVEKYIVVTTAAVNASGALNSLVTWKTQKGLLAKVYTVEWIDSTYSGFDTQEKIRNFLKDRYTNNALEWVQLVGDNDTVPVREVVNPNPILPFDDNWIPTDTYYACLDSASTWDFWTPNNIYGEVQDDNADGQYDHNDLDDKLPDVWVGRFASNNTARISVWANNSVNYEKSPATGNWTHTALAIAPAAMPVSNAVGVKNKMEEYINKTGGAFGYLGDLYGSGNVTRLYEADGTLSRNNIITAFNRGFAFGTWMANGGFDSLNSSSALGTLFNYTNVNGLTNGARRPVIFGYSSSSGWFDGQECLGEALTENNTANGAMGFIGPARTSHISIILGYNNANPNATGVQMDFLNQMVLGKYTASTENLYMGRTLGNGKYAFANWWSMNYEDALKAFYLFNLFGETNCPIWYDLPKDLIPFTKIYEGPDDKTITVEVKSANGTHLNQSLVCIYNTAMGYYAANRTGNDGFTYFSVPRNMNDTSMTITRPGYLPVEQTVAVLDTWAPDTLLNVTPPDPDGKNGWYKTTPRILLLTEPNATTHYNWDCSTVFLPYNISNGPLMAPDGDHQLFYYSRDHIGNGDSKTWRSAQFSVDATIPNSTAHVTPPAPDGDNGWYITQPVVNFTINNTLGYATLKYMLDTGSFMDYMVNITIQEGLHELFYYAETSAGNREPQRSLSFKIDVTAPSSTILKNPLSPDGKNGWYRTVPSIYLTPDIAGDLVFYHWDDEPEQNTTTGSLKAPEGMHTLFWQSRDEAGNREAVRNVTVMVDTKSPVTNVTTAPAEPDGKNGWFTGKTAIDLDPGENGTAFYAWDQGLYLFCVTGPLELMEGIHTLFFYSNDTAGNHETNRQQLFKLDTGIPMTNMTVSPADKGMDWYIKKPRVKFETDAGSHIFYYWDTEITSVQQYTKEFEVSEGEHTLHYYALDDAGNKEIERTKLFKVDSLVPVVALTISSTVSNVNDNLIFNVSGTDANGLRDFNIDFGDGNMTGWLTSLSFDHVYRTPGNYTIYARGRDPADNEGRSNAVLLEVKAPYVPPPVNPPPKTEEKFNWLLPMVAMVAIVAVIGILAFAISRRKGSRQPDQKKEEAERLYGKKEPMPAWGGAEEGATAPTSITEQAEGRDFGAAAATMPVSASSGPTPSGARTMSCPKCGNEVEADADYCYTCGERWGKKGTRATADADLYKEVRAPPAAVREAPQSYYAPEPAPEQIEEAPTVPVEPRPAPAQTGDLDDIMSRLETITSPKPAPAPKPAAERPHVPLPQSPRPVSAVRAVASVPASPATRAAAMPAAKPAPPHEEPAAATAQGGTGKACPKCGTEMARLVELPGAQNEQLKRLNAKGQHAFQCRKCGHFEISKWP